MNGNVVGLFCGNNTEEDESEYIIVNLITEKVVEWINSIEFK